MIHESRAAGASRLVGLASAAVLLLLAGPVAATIDWMAVTGARGS